MKSKIISLALSLVLISSLSIPVLAIDSSGSTGNSEAVITQESSTFSVTVPTGLPVAVDKDGTVTTASNTKIINNSYGPVKVRNVSVTPLNSWSIVDYDKDFSKEKIGLKEFGFILNGDEVTIDGNLELTEDSWSTISGKSELGLTYNANLGVQKVSQNIDIANVVFTVGWDSSDSTPDIKYVLAQDSDFSGTADGDFRYKGTDKYVEVPHVIKGIPVTSYKSMFAYTVVEGVKSTNPNVTDMSFMFSISRATTLNLSRLDTFNVTDMSYMFDDSKATTLDLSNINTSSVTNMSSMFRKSYATSLDLSGFNTSNVTNMEGMFWYSRATILDISNFNTSSVTNMNNMFGDSYATTLYLSSFNTSNVTDMGGMFSASQVTTLDLSSFDTSKVTNMRHMFSQMVTSTLDLSSFDIGSFTNMAMTFYNNTATVGYAKTQTDADRLNASSSKPATLTFIVK